jgi:hypothetical protein
LDIADIEVVQPHGSDVVVTKSEKKIQFSYDDDFYYFVACSKPPLDSSGEGCFWKVTIDTYPDDTDWLFLGIIGNLNAEDFSEADSTAYGWSNGVSNGDSNGDVWANGSCRHRDSDFTGFSQGDCLYFHLKSNKLTMFSVKRNQKSVIDIMTTECNEFYIHFNFEAPGTKISLEPLNEDEQTRMLENES